ENDFHAIQKTKDVSAVAPLSTVSGNMTGDYTVDSPFIIATTGDFTKIVDQPLQSGGFFTDSNEDVNAVVLGMNLAEKLFNDNAPLGQALAWHGQRFIVTGVFEDFKAPPFSLETNFNDAVFIPYSTAQKLTGGALGVYQILGKSDSSNNVSQTIHNATSALVTAHGGAHDVT